MKNITDLMESTPNGGKMFQERFVNNFQYYLTKMGPKLGDIIEKHNLQINLNNCEAIDTSKQRVRRSIFVNSRKKLEVQHKDYKEIADAVIKSNNNQLYIQLKWGDTTDMYHGSLGGLFNEYSFAGFMERGEFAGSKEDTKAKEVLSALGIDPKDFYRAYSLYKTSNNLSHKRVSVDPKIYMDFIKSAIESGYVLVHEDTKGDLDIIDLMDDRAVKNFIGKPTAAEIEYCFNTAKEVKIRIYTSTCDFIIRIRNANGGVLPDSISLNYKVINDKVFA